MQLGKTDSISQTVHQAREVLTSGGLLVFPTETVYGIAASAASQKGFESLQAFKGRGHPFTIHLPNPDAAGRYIDLSDPVLRRLVHKVFPGPITLVVDADQPQIDRLQKESGLEPQAINRLYHQKTVGLRCPDSPIGQAVLGAIEAPVVASSANRPGQAPPHTAEDAARCVGDAAEMIADGGPCRLAKPSTIVRVFKEDGRFQVNIIRQGAYDERLIKKLMQWTAVFVCSGNTCRSPMAEGIAKQALAQQYGVSVDQLGSVGAQALSAGIFAFQGMPATPEAIDVMNTMGIDLTRHYSQPLSPELIHQADVLYCMTPVHRSAVIHMSPTAEDKIQMLVPDGEVSDPIGSGLSGYQQCAKLIQHQVTQRLKEQLP